MPVKARFVQLTFHGEIIPKGSFALLVLRFFGVFKRKKSFLLRKKLKGTCWPVGNDDIDAVIYHLL